MKYLPQFPNYSTAQTVETVHASDLAEEFFIENFVKNNRPCKIIGAAKHWSASSLWSSKEYLQSKLPNLPVKARTDVLPEFLQFVRPADVREKMIKDRNDKYIEFYMHDLIEQLFEPSDDSIVLHALPVEPAGLFSGIYPDLGVFNFAKNVGRSRMYAPFRVFMYRNSYTDWHFHPTDETFMLQLVGDKEVLALPPTSQTWNVFRPIAESTGQLYDATWSSISGASVLPAIRCMVSPGDALYIPAFWWHAVESADSGFGVTLASTFATPLEIAGDLRYPAVRRLLKEFVFTPFFPYLASAVCYALLYRAVKRSKACFS
jgi:hypothetical protein